MDMPVSQVATDRVARAAPTAPLHQVAAMMADDESSTVVICVEDRPVGIVTERDLVNFLGRVLRGDAAVAGSIAEIMTAPVITVSGHDLMTDVASIMHRKRIRSLPVVNGAGAVTGLLRFTDVLASTVGALEQQRDELEFEVATRTAQLQEAHDALLVLSHQDGLTGLGNRRGMEKALQEAASRATRYGSRYAVVLADIDHFKLYNDHYGHPAGDEALRRVAIIVRRQLRDLDSGFRYGGEEVLALLPETDIAGATVLAERLRAAVEAEAIKHELAPRGVVTLSIGVAALGAGQRDNAWEMVVASADGALYAAKDSGRNCVVRCEPSMADDLYVVTVP